MGSPGAFRRHPASTVTLDPGTDDQLRTLDPVALVWADIEFVNVGTLHLKCFPAAESDSAVLVQTAWQGRLQQVLVSQDKVTRRALDPRTQ